MSLADKNRERAKRAAENGEAAFLGDPHANRLRGFVENRVYDGMPDAEIEAALVKKGVDPDAAVRMIAAAKTKMPSAASGIALMAIGGTLMLFAVSVIAFVLQNGGYFKLAAMLGGLGLATFVGGVNKFRDVRDRMRKVREKKLEA